MQHPSAVHQRVFLLQEVSETVELLEPGAGVMLAVRAMIWHLDRDGVLDRVRTVVCAERDPGDPGAEERASCQALPSSTGKKVASGRVHPGQQAAVANAFSLAGYHGPLRSAGPRHGGLGTVRS